MKMDSYLALQLGNSTAKTKKAYGERIHMMFVGLIWQRGDINAEELKMKPFHTGLLIQVAGGTPTGKRCCVLSCSQTPMNSSSA